ncbi:MAG: hypothetical protein ACI3X1_00225 [Eubacteriales bacterium]
MKRSVFLLFTFIVLFLLFGCTTIDNGETKESGEGSVTNKEEATTYSYSEGIYPGKDWADVTAGSENPDTSSGDAIVPNKETAISIADKAFEEVKLSGICQSYVLQGVFYDTEDNIWVVYFGEDSEIPGSCYNIAISKATGEIIKMWASE